VRDVFQYRGLVICNADGRLAQITLDQAEPLAACRRGHSGSAFTDR